MTLIPGKISAIAFIGSELLSHRIFRKRGKGCKNVANLPNQRFNPSIGLMIINRVLKLLGATLGVVFRPVD